MRYHSGPERTREQWQWRGTPHFPKLQDHWNLTIRLFSVISRTLIGGCLTSLQRSSQFILQPQPTGQRWRVFMGGGASQLCKEYNMYGHLTPITKTIQVRRTKHAVYCWRSKDEPMSDVLHMDEQKQDDQLEPIYKSSVPIQDASLKTCRKQWTIEKGGKKGLGISVLMARHDYDDEWYWKRLLIAGKEHAVATANKEKHMVHTMYEEHDIISPENKTNLI